MGRDKALLPLGSRTMVHEIGERVASAAGSCILIGDPDRYGDMGWECLSDIRHGLGPLAGIETALAARRTDSNLIIACDMPDVKREWLGCLLSAARETPRLAVISRDNSGHVHPLCAVYKSGALAIVQHALDSGRLKLMDLIEELEADEVQIPGTIYNLNTSIEWENWLNAPH